MKTDIIDRYEELSTKLVSVLLYMQEKNQELSKLIRKKDLEERSKRKAESVAYGYNTAVEIVNLATRGLESLESLFTREPEPLNDEQEELEPVSSDQQEEPEPVYGPYNRVLEIADRLAASMEDFCQNDENKIKRLGVEIFPTLITMLEEYSSDYTGQQSVMYMVSESGTLSGRSLSDLCFYESHLLYLAQLEGLLSEDSAQFLGGCLAAMKMKDNTGKTKYVIKRPWLNDYRFYLELLARVLYKGEYKCFCGVLEDLDCTLACSNTVSKRSTEELLRSKESWNEKIASLEPRFYKLRLSYIARLRIVELELEARESASHSMFHKGVNLLPTVSGSPSKTMSTCPLNSLD